MIGPAGFMQAPNTHAMRGLRDNETPKKPWERIALNQVWASANTKGFATVEELPAHAHDVVGLRHTNGRLTHKRVDRFLKQYEQIGLGGGGPMA